MGGARVGGARVGGARVGGAVNRPPTLQRYNYLYIYRVNYC
jgi:hypothetical protein